MLRVLGPKRHGPSFMTYADLRKKDPVIRELIVSLISRNVQRPEIDAIEKILIEGADGRYLAEVTDFSWKVSDC